MTEPWLSIVGVGEDGLTGLTRASLDAIASADVVFGGPRHLALVDAGPRGRPWPVPFSIAPVLALRGQPVVVLASGDPFWYGAGAPLAAALPVGEWVCHPAPSTFALAAARLGWRLEETACLGLHAAPFERLRTVLGPGVRVICLMRDGPAVARLAAWLTARGHGASRLTVLEALGGPRERLRETTAAGFDLADVVHPVALAIEAAGGSAFSRAVGLPDELFASDGQITKRPIRALTLSALAPRPGAVLWDLGAGSGSISVEWCLAAPGATAHAVESRGDRFVNIRANAEAFGFADRLHLHGGDWHESLAALPRPDAVFIGGGASEVGIETLLTAVGAGVRIVANAVTLETEALLVGLHGRHGGTLLRIELSEPAPLGRMRGWQPARPVVQWSHLT